MKKIVTFLVLLLLVKMCQAQCTGTPDEPIIKIKHVGSNYVLYAASSTAGLKCTWFTAPCSSLIPATFVVGGTTDSIKVPDTDFGWAYLLSTSCTSSGLYSNSCAICVPFTKDVAKVPAIVRSCPGDTLTINATVYLSKFCKQIQWQDSSSGMIPGATSKTLKVIAPATANAYRVVSFWPDDSTTYSAWVSYRPYYCSYYGHWASPEGSTEDEPSGTFINEEFSATQSYNIYPNPSSDGNINIIQKVTSAKPVDILIYNTQGSIVYKTIKSFSTNALSLHLDNLPTGIYLMHIMNESDSYRLRFTINK